MGTPSYLIDDASMLQPRWLTGVRSVGVTAGASAPEILVQEVIDSLGRHGRAQVETLPGVQENTQFKLPRQLIEAAAG